MKYTVVIAVVVILEPLIQETQQQLQPLGQEMIQELEIFIYIAKMQIIKDQNPNYLWQPLF